VETETAVKYGTFKYGDGTKYGLSAISDLTSDGEVVWIVSIDWDGTGYTNEADNLTALSGFCGAEHYVGYSGDGFEAFQPAKYTLTMTDHDRRYDALNTDSPLYPYVMPGRDAQIAVYIRETGVTIPLITGTITDIQPVSGREEVTIVIEDGMRDLDTDVSIGIVSNATIDQCIGLTLDAAGWNGARNLRTTNQPVQIYSAESEKALDLVNSLAMANLGSFFVDRNGRATFYPISYRSSTVTTLTQDLLLKEIRQPQPWEMVRNSITVIANQKAKRPGSVIWSIGKPLEIGAGATVTFGQGFDLSTGISQPRPYTDYIANTASNGSGTDVTDQVTVLFSSVYDQETLMSIKNNTAASAWILKLNLLGHKIVNCPEPSRSEDATSIAYFRRKRTLKLDNPFLQDRQFASTYAGWIKDFLKNPKRAPVIQIRQRPSVQYALYLMDRVNLSVTSRDIDDTLTIRGIRHEWQNDTGQDVLTTVYLADMLYNTTEITPEPYVPGDEPVSEVPFTDIPPYIDPYDPLDGLPITINPPDMSDYCLWTDAETNGPFSTTWTPLTGLTNRNEIASEMERFIWYPCTLRKGNAINPSYITVDATWWIEQPTLVHDESNAWWHVDAIDANKNVLCSGTIENLTAFKRKVTFRPTNAVEIAGFRVWIETKAGSVSLGDQVSTGNIDVTSSTGETVSGLTVGNYYAIEGSGGPFSYNTANPELGDAYVLEVKPDAIWVVLGGYRTVSGYLEGTPGSGIVFLEHRLDGLYSRGFFCATGTSIAVRAADTTTWVDNGGSLSYILREAFGPGPRTLSLITVRAYNVCGQGIL
jgi:hypothetical protein